ncbi:MAG TPA: NAD-dependent epimerase/dehydratase family protein [Gemmatimonadales bacterium]|nr:NAD-dependent epimerase/dehydratase family protein [Gemmatimonadales bacterium]
MNTLVTGATGFVGGHVVAALLTRGIAVTALVRSPSRAAALERLGVRLVVGDLHDDVALRRACEGQAVVQHVAGVIAARDEAAYLRANRDGTANLLRAAEAAGVDRFVLMSSGAAAGPSRPAQPRTAEEPPAPVTAYGRSKLAGEDVVRRGALPWVILRPPTVYGPNDRDNLIKVFRLVRYGMAPVFGDGSQELSAVYAPDLAEAAVLAGSEPGVAGGTYFVNHPEVITSAELVRLIGKTMHRRVHVISLPGGLVRPILHFTGGVARLAGKATILNADKANEFLQAAWTADPSPFMRDAGWLPAFDLASGLAETWRWYRDAGWL